MTFSDFCAKSQPIFLQLDVLCIDAMFKFQILLFVYQAKYLLLPKSCLRYFVVNNAKIHNTRMISYFKLLPYRNNIRKNAIAVIGPKLWNDIPIAIQAALCISLFKNLLKNWMLGQDE